MLHGGALFAWFNFGRPYRHLPGLPSLSEHDTESHPRLLPPKEAQGGDSILFRHFVKSVARRSKWSIMRARRLMDETVSLNVKESVRLCKRGEVYNYSPSLQIGRSALV